MPRSYGQKYNVCVRDRVILSANGIILPRLCLSYDNKFSRKPYNHDKHRRGLLIARHTMHATFALAQSQSCTTNLAALLLAIFRGKTKPTHRADDLDHTSAELQHSCLASSLRTCSVMQLHCIHPMPTAYMCGESKSYHKFLLSVFNSHRVAGEVVYRR